MSADEKERRLKDVGENELVADFVAMLGEGSDQVLHGPGDDCAVVESSADNGKVILLKTDCVVEGVHFEAAVEPGRVGWKAMARVLSDIGAMGGNPEHALVTMVLPGERTVDWATGIFSGLERCAKEFGAEIVGGETSSGPVAMISVAMTGSVERDRVVTRAGGSAGDLLCVTGRLGGSIAGKHLDFTPRIREGSWLAEHARPTAMMDLSDGLGSDLPRLAKASGVEFRVNEEALPLNDGCDVQSGITDGEDYELLFALAPDGFEEVVGRFETEFPGVGLTCIGVLTDDASEGSFSEGGWNHFAG
ncbi:MAG: thiamine-phosphate kinase [Verrucomicrobiota bacterium]